MTTTTTTARPAPPPIPDPPDGDSAPTLALVRLALSVHLAAQLGRNRAARRDARRLCNLTESTVDRLPTLDTEGRPLPAHQTSTNPDPPTKEHQ